MHHPAVHHHHDAPRGIDRFHGPDLLNRSPATTVIAWSLGVRSQARAALMAVTDQPGSARPSAPPTPTGS